MKHSFTLIFIGFLCLFHNITLSQTAYYVDGGTPDNGAVVSYTNGTQVLVASAGTFTGYDVGDIVEFTSGTANMFFSTIQTWTDAETVTLTTPFGADFVDGTINVIDMDLIPNIPDPFKYISTAVTTSAANDTIDVTGTVTQDVAGGIVLDKNLYIRGHGKSASIYQANALKGAAANRLFVIPTGISVTIKDFTMRHGVASINGAGILNYGNLNLQGAMLVDNVTNTGTGGALASCIGSTVNAKNCDISYNYAKKDGGGIWAETATLLFDKTSFVGNSCGSYGAGLYIRSNGTTTIVNSTINDHISGANGVGIYAGYGAITKISFTIMQYNRGGWGGGIFQEFGGSCEIKSSNISYNYATNGGGIATSNGTTWLIWDSTISFNTSSSNGGGIMESSGPLVNDFCILKVYRTLIAHNYSFGLGGGVYARDGQNIFSNSTFAFNKTNTSGGGIYCYAHNVGGASRSQNDFDNVTIAYNKANIDGAGANEYGGGIRQERTNAPSAGSYNKIRMINSIVADNTSGITDVPDDYHSYLLNTTAIQSFEDLGSNIIENTRMMAAFTPFVLLTHPTSSNGENTQINLNPTLGYNGGYSQTLKLNAGSICIDAGLSNGAVDYDQRNFARVYDTGPRIVDIGAYEYYGDEGPPGRCLDFDGIDDRLYIANNPTMDVNTGASPYTIDLWVFPRQVDNEPLVYKGVGGTSIYITGGSITFDGLVSANEIISVNIWSHISAINNTGVCTVYVNGAPHVLPGTATTVSTINPLLFGTDGVNYFDGRMDELRVWSLARGESQLRDDMCNAVWGDDVGLKGYWRLDDFKTSVATDHTTIMGVSERNDGIAISDGTTIIVNDGEAIWSSNGAVANVTTVLEAIDFKVDAGAAKHTIDAAYTTGNFAYNDFAAVDLSTYQCIGFWIKSSVATKFAELKLLIDDNNNCVSPVESLGIPSLAANTWTYVVLDFTDFTGATRNAIVSVGLNMTTDLGACDVLIDDAKTFKHDDNDWLKSDAFSTWYGITNDWADPKNWSQQEEPIYTTNVGIIRSMNDPLILTIGASHHTIFATPAHIEISGGSLNVAGNCFSNGGQTGTGILRITNGHGLHAVAGTYEHFELDDPNGLYLTNSSTVYDLTIVNGIFEIPTPTILTVTKP